MMMEYTIDELALIPGCACYAYGVADVFYTVAPPDPECGMHNWSIDDIQITGISLDGHGVKDTGRQLDSTEPLYKLIEAALYRGDHLSEACLEHYGEQEPWDEY